MLTPKEFRLPGSSPAIALQELGEGPLVIFLHGIGGNAGNWIRQLQALSKDYLAVAWDMRGYGNSEDFDGPFEVEDICNDLLSVINYYDVNQAHVVGLSMGGMIAQQFYLRHPGKVSSLVLANTNAGIGVAFSQQQKTEFVHLRRQPLLEGMEPTDLVQTMLDTLLGENPPQSAIDNISASIASLHKTSYIKAIEAIIDFDCSAVLAKISVPVLFIGSSLDRVIPVDSMKAMSKVFSGSQLYIFDGVGHLSNLERPEEFNELLLDFLAQV
jgi:3-oxoadipate enol-lactonase